MNIEEAVERGRAAAIELSRATNDLTETLSSIEQFMVELNWGVQGRVKIYDEALAFELGFGRCGKEWHLLIITNEDRRPLQQASRKERMLAIEGIVELIEQLAETVVKTASDVEEKRIKADSILALLAGPR